MMKGMGGEGVMTASQHHAVIFNGDKMACGGGKHRREQREGLAGMVALPLLAAPIAVHGQLLFPT